MDGFGKALRSVDVRLCNFKFRGGFGQWLAKEAIFRAPPVGVPVPRSSGLANRFR